MVAKLLKSTAMVSLMTLISRISGLVRDIVMANLLGASALADAFFVAFRIPNFLRRIFAEGAFSQAFVPVFSELTVRNTEEARRFVSASFGWLALSTLFITVLGIAFADGIISILAPGFVDDQVKFNATVEALQIMFPYLFCISLVAMSAGVLNTTNRFAVAAATPIILNLCLILAMWKLMPLLDDAAQALAYGVLIAGVCQVLWQLPALKQSGYLVWPKLDLQNSHVFRVGKLMLPAILSVSVAQINLLVNTFLASFLVTGSVTWLYFSDRLMEFPVGVFGIALATVVLPSLSKEHTAGTASGFSAMLDWALKWVVMISVPATSALIILAVPLLTTLFNYNNFTTNDVLQSAVALQAFAAGVCGFIFVKVLAPGFFARQDTTTPMRVAVVAMIANVVLSIALVGSLKHAGLAWAISIAAWLNAGLLWWVLLKRQIHQPTSDWWFYLLRITIAVAVMSGLLISLSPADQVWFDWTLAERVFNLSWIVAVGGLSYFLCLALLGLNPKMLLSSPSG
ncbi:MAG: murein biosynthesis integral membrane protein MurJ [Pseudomonadota bacterium]